MRYSPWRRGEARREGERVVEESCYRLLQSPDPDLWHGVPGEVKDALFVADELGSKPGLADPAPPVEDDQPPAVSSPFFLREDGFDLAVGKLP
ncbi:MAG: hypothetical protein WCY70_08300 [Methanoculleus sp.]